MVVLIIFPVILQTVINVIMLSIGRQGVIGTDMLLIITSTSDKLFIGVNVDDLE